VRSYTGWWGSAISTALPSGRLKRAGSMKNEMTQGFDDPVKFREEWDKQTEGK